MFVCDPHPYTRAPSPTQKSGELVFIASKLPAVRGGRIPAMLRNMGMKMATKLPSKRFVVYDLPEGRFVPTYFKGSSIYHMTPTDVNAAKPKWLHDTPAFFPAYQEKLANIWYYASRVLPLFTLNVRCCCVFAGCRCCVWRPVTRRRGSPAFSFHSCTANGWAPRPWTTPPSSSRRRRTKSTTTGTCRC